MAGEANTTGSDNAFFGSEAGRANTTGSNNVFIGRSAGNANTIGGSNTAIGAGASVGSGSVTFATAIGAGAQTSGSNMIVLGTSTERAFVPGSLLYAMGRIRVDALDVSGTTQLCRNNANNQIAQCSSSLRYKNKIAPFVPGLELINKLRPITFSWKSNGERDVGLAAEDVAKVEPLLVTRTSNGQVEGVKYDRINVALINAVKQQQTQIKALRQQVEDLRKMVCVQSPNANLCKR